LVERSTKKVPKIVSQTAKVSGQATSTTRDRLVAAARELFWLQGFEATSVAEILEAAGARSGSFYYFFKGKEDLLLAVLDGYLELLWPAVIEPAFSRTGDPIERIFEILAGYRLGLAESLCTKGCPIGELALETSNSYPAAREKAVENFEQWVGWIHRCIEDAAARLPGVDPRRLATFVLTVMEGAVMQAKARRSLEPFDTSVAELRDYFSLLMARRDT
jgi:AcrR family transcriptional regulator